jgi:hypothetical protein
MGPSTRIIRAGLLVAAAVVLAAAAAQLRDKRQMAELTVENIHQQLDALDPATRAAVIARLSSDEVKKVRGHRQLSREPLRPSWPPCASRPRAAYAVRIERLTLGGCSKARIARRQ